MTARVNPAIGLRDMCKTNGRTSLTCFAKRYGVSVESLTQSTGWESGDCVSPAGSLLLVDRLGRLLHVLAYFKSWKESIDSLPGEFTHSHSIDASHNIDHTFNMLHVYLA